MDFLPTILEWVEWLLVGVLEWVGWISWGVLDWLVWLIQGLVNTVVAMFRAFLFVFGEPLVAFLLRLQEIVGWVHMFDDF